MGMGMGLILDKGEAVIEDRAAPYSEAEKADRSGIVDLFQAANANANATANAVIPSFHRSINPSRSLICQSGNLAIGQYERPFYFTFLISPFSLALFPRSLL